MWTNKQIPCQFLKRPDYGSEKGKIFQMIDLNPMNFVTIGIIAIAGYALFRFGLKATGMATPSWLA